MAVADYLKVFVNRRFAIVALLGFSSGLPLPLTSGTLQAWYSLEGIDIMTIGLLSWIGFPYLFKFLWAPLADRYIPPILGRRRGWMLLTQIFIGISLFGMAFLNPQQDAFTLALLALVVAFMSATQDISVDAYRTDVLEPQERGFGSASSIAAYRIAMLVGGGIALIFADQIGWQKTYILMAFLMIIGILASLMGEDPLTDNQIPPSLKIAIIEPIKELFSRKQVILLLCFIALYKLGDAFTLSLTTPFLLKGIGFSATDVGAITKVVGLIATLLGVSCAGFLMIRVQIFTALLVFGILQALSNAMFMLLAIVGKNYLMMSSAVFIENFCGGLGTAAFFAFLMSLCHRKYTATQFALLSAIASVGRVVVGPGSAWIVQHFGWAQFYLLTVFIAIPGVILLYYLRSGITSGKLEPRAS